MICFIHRFPELLLGAGEYHTFQGGGTGIAPLRLFVFLLFLFVASKILTGSQGIPHFELWARLGSSFSSFYFFFFSSSSPFPSTKVAGGRGGHFLDPYWASPSAAGQPRFNSLVAVPPPVCVWQFANPIGAAADSR